MEAINIFLWGFAAGAWASTICWLIANSRLRKFRKERDKRNKEEYKILDEGINALERKMITGNKIEIKDILILLKKYLKYSGTSELEKRKKSLIDF